MSDIISELVVEQQKTVLRLQKNAQRFLLGAAVQLLVEFEQKLNEISETDIAVSGWTITAEEVVRTQLALVIAEIMSAQGEGLIKRSKTAALLSRRNVAKYLKELDLAYSGTYRPLRFNLGAWFADKEHFLIERHSRSLARWGAEISDKFRQEIAKSMVLGEGWLPATERLRKIAKGRVKAADWMLSRIARTEMSNVYNAAAVASMAEQDSPGDRMYKKLVATFDSRTGVDSVMLHGQTVPVDQPFYDAYFGKEYMYPPNRPNDREIVVAWRERYAKFFNNYDSTTAGWSGPNDRRDLLAGVRPDLDINREKAVKRKTKIVERSMSKLDKDIKALAKVETQYLPKEVRQSYAMQKKALRGKMLQMREERKRLLSLL